MEILKVFGIVSAILYSLLFLAASISLYHHLIPYHPPLYSTRKIFHIFLSIYGALQTLSFYNFCFTGSYNKWTYTAHLLGIFTEISSLSLVCILWSKTLISSSYPRRLIMPILCCIDAGFFTAIVVFILQMYSNNLSFFAWIQETNAVTILLIAEPIALMTNVFLLLYLGYRIYKKVLNQPLEEEHKRVIQCRLMGTMLVCGLFFTTRSVFLLFLLCTGGANFSTDSMYILLFWVPSIVPAGMLLFTMNQSKQISEQDPLHRPSFVSDHCRDISTDLSRSGRSVNPEDPRQYSHHSQIGFDVVFAPLLNDATTLNNDVDAVDDTGEKQFGRVSVDFFQGAPQTTSFRLRSPDSEYSDS